MDFVGLFVGVNHYEKLQGLRGAVNDAMAMYDFYKETFDSSNLCHFTPCVSGTASPSPRIQNLHAAIQTLQTACRRGRAETALFFFSGHGFEINGEPFFAFSDYEPGPNRSAPRGVVSLRELRSLLSFAESVTFIVDACRDPLPAPSAARFPDAFTTHLLPDTQVILGCRAGQKTREAPNVSGEHHGIFTNACIRALREMHRSDRGVLGQALVEEIKRLTDEGQTPICRASDDTAPLRVVPSIHPNRFRAWLRVTITIRFLALTSVAILGIGIVGIATGVIPNPLARPGIELSLPQLHKDIADFIRKAQKDPRNIKWSTGTEARNAFTDKDLDDFRRNDSARHIAERVLKSAKGQEILKRLSALPMEKREEAIVDQVQPASKTFNEIGSISTTGEAQTEAGQEAEILLAEEIVAGLRNGAP